ncbi:transglutaminase domain-containing protein [Achromobacter veterisilvae]|uniref:Transglutaminase domain-containing protein n=1 Tax=Achromobacter veterisilvae TaxID=2069367 RepID=A0ABZ2S1S5_9BURK
MDRFACYTEHAADGALLVSGGPGGQSATGQREIFMVLEAMNLVQDTASSARYAWYQHQLGVKFVPPNSTEQEVCLESGFGICGNHQLVFLDLMEKVGIPARPVNFWYTDRKLNKRANHAAVEVHIAGKWRYVDVTWGTIWLRQKRDPLSALTVEEVLKGEGQRLTGATNTWYLVQRQHNVDPFSYLQASDVQMTRSGGMLKLSLSDQPETFNGLPNYVGSPPDSDALSYSVRQREAGGQLEIAMSGASICNNSKLMVGDQAFDISPNTVIDADFDKAELKVQVVGQDEDCYVVMASMTRRPPGAAQLR